MNQDYHALLQQALRDVAEGDANKAFLTFRPVLSYPGMVKGRAPLMNALNVFSQIGTALIGEDFAALMQAGVRNPDDVDTLYKLGYELIEHELPDLAATLLARAHELAPRNEAVFTELIAALERITRHDETCRLLWANPLFLQQSFLCRYLLA